MLNTFFDPYLQFAFWTGVGAVALALLETALIIYLRFALIRRTRREQAFQVIWRPILVKALSSRLPSSLPTLDATQHVFFLRLWVQLQESLRGPESAGLLDVALRVGCDKFARGLLKEGNPAERLLAILALGHLGDRSAWRLLANVARAKDTISSLSAVRALIQIDATKAASEFMALLLGRTDWPQARIAAMLQSEQATFTEPLMNAANLAKGGHLIRLLRLLEALRLQPPILRLSLLLSGDQLPDIVIGALRVTLAPGLLPRVRELAGHADWRVRVQVAKVLGRIGEMQDVVLLSNLLSDPEWWVRYCAASALIGLPFVSRPQVEMLHHSIEDPYARDMLEQVLFEKAAA